MEEAVKYSVGVGDMLGEVVAVEDIEGVALREGVEVEEADAEAEGELDAGDGIGMDGQPRRRRRLRSHWLNPSSDENAPKHATLEFKRRAHQAPCAPTKTENCPEGGASVDAPVPKHAISQARVSPQAVVFPSVTMMRKGKVGSCGQRTPQQLTSPAELRAKVAPPPLCATRSCSVSGGLPAVAPQHFARLPVVTPHA